MRVLLQALADGPHEISPVLANAFLFLVDAPRTRVYLHPGTDLEVRPLRFITAEMVTDQPLDRTNGVHRRLWERRCTRRAHESILSRHSYDVTKLEWWVWEGLFY